MIRRHPGGLLVVFLMIVALGASGTGCSDNPVGRLCDLGTDTPKPGETTIASPSLDCVSRTCLRFTPTRELPPGSVPPEGTTGLCTAECSTDDDCDRVPESPCVLGFTCGIPPGGTVGELCCRKFCVCKDYVDLSDSGQLPAPEGCNPGPKPNYNDNACCNLEGRENGGPVDGQGKPKYPLCKR
jgi:hypothetical protein